LTEIYRIIAEKEFYCNISRKHIYIIIINENREVDIKIKFRQLSILRQKTNTIFSCFVEIAKNNSINPISKKFDIIISSEQWKNIMYLYENFMAESLNMFCKAARQTS